ncbi:hypothetical protein M5D96_005123 [Drosophila gunungcola]|uniref:Uncharacterized protein n=1 Tax=Drosophila gunungcola TaxID=103775 RepID=A0A9P9YVR1_9MUSC|nr:hypothetical protein M5D96_005123 [Drosophila gunungcola]
MANQEYRINCIKYALLIVSILFKLTGVFLIGFSLEVSKALNTSTCSLMYTYQLHRRFSSPLDFLSSQWPLWELLDPSRRV